MLYHVVGFNGVRFTIYGSTYEIISSALNTFLKCTLQSFKAFFPNGYGLGSTEIISLSLNESMYNTPLKKKIVIFLLVGPFTWIVGFLPICRYVISWMRRFLVSVGIGKY